MLFFYLFLLAIGITILLKATDFSIKLIEKIGLKVKIPAFVLSSIFLAMATSFPEFFVGVFSAINKEPILSLGNIFGANFANLSLILGLATIISGGVKVKEKLLFKDVFAAFLVALVPYVLIFDKEINRLDGLILILVYIFYNIFLINGERKALLNEDPKGLTKAGKLVLKLLFWIIVLATSAQLVVYSSENISRLINFPIVLIGILLLAFGTTLPELMVQIKSAENKEEGIFFGNILGSVVINSSLILGIVSLICPIKITVPAHFIFLGIFTLAVFALIPIFLRSKRILERNEGIVLLAIYIIFVLTGVFFF